MAKNPANADPGWQPIEVEVGTQNLPAVSEVDFTPVVPNDDKAPTKPQRAATPKED